MDPHQSGAFQSYRKGKGPQTEEPTCGIPHAGNGLLGGGQRDGGVTFRVGQSPRRCYTRGDETQGVDAGDPEVDTGRLTVLEQEGGAREDVNCFTSVLIGSD